MNLLTIADIFWWCAFNAHYAILNINAPFSDSSLQSHIWFLVCDGRKRQTTSGKNMEKNCAKITNETFKRKKMDVEFCIRISIGIHRRLNEAWESGVTPGNYMCARCVRSLCWYVNCSMFKQENMFNAYNCVHMYFGIVTDEPNELCCPLHNGKKEVSNPSLLLLLSAWYV